MNTIAALKC